MNKQELIEQIAEHAAVNRVVAERVLDGLVAVVIERLKTEGEIKLAELGRFTTQVRAAHTALNPRTHQPIDVPAKTAVRFKPGKALTAAVQAPR